MFYTSYNGDNPLGDNVIIALAILVLLISVIVIILGYIEIMHMCAEMETQLEEKDDETLELKRTIIENACRNR